MLTEAVRRQLFSAGSNGKPLAVIPCCADLSTITGRAGERDEVREELGARDRPVMVYVGKFTGWYLEAEMVDFFAAARAERPDLLFVVLTQSEFQIIEHELERAGIPPSDYRIARAKPDDVGRYLAAAEFGLSFVRPCPSKISSSPPRSASTSRRVSPWSRPRASATSTSCSRGRGVGLLVSRLRRSDYETAARGALELAADPEARERCRRVARETLSLEDVGVARYDDLYRQVARA